MLIAIRGVKFYAQCYTRGKVYGHCYTWSEAICSIMTTAIHKVMLYAHTYTCSEALCSMLYKGESLCALLYME